VYAHGTGMVPEGVRCRFFMHTDTAVGREELQLNDIQFTGMGVPLSPGTLRRQTISIVFNLSSELLFWGYQNWWLPWSLLREACGAFAPHSCYTLPSPRMTPVVPAPGTHSYP
jgi:hypothetical protein